MDITRMKDEKIHGKKTQTCIKYKQHFWYIFTPRRWKQLTSQIELFLFLSSSLNGQWLDSHTLSVKMWEIQCSNLHPYYNVPSSYLLSYIYGTLIKLLYINDIFLVHTGSSKDPLNFL
jgi:hypothetical protein